MIRVGVISDTHEDERATCAGKIILGPDGINIRAADRRRCFQAAVQGAIDREVDLILHAGDPFERPKPTPAEYVAVELCLDRAADHAPTILVACNHGMNQSSTEQHAIAPLAARHFSLFVCLRPDFLTLATKAGLVQIAILPFPQKSVLLAKDEYQGLSPESVNQIIAEKLSAIIRGFRARLDPKLPSILLTHMMIKEAIFGEDQAAQFGMLAMSAEDFEGFDLIVAGDIHRHQIIGDRLVIPGSTDRCSFGEEHEAKGWCYIELDGPGAVPRVELVETPARRYITWVPDNIRDEGLLHQALMEYREDLKTCPVFRVKGQVSQEEYDALQPFLARWREIPTFSESLEVTRQTRARSEAMTGELSDVAAIKEWFAVNNRTENLDELLEEHHRLMGAR